MADSDSFVPGQPAETHLTYHGFATVTTLAQLNQSSMSRTSQRYFMSHVDESHTSIQRLVGRAFALSDTSNRLPSKEEAAYHLQSAMFCNSLKHSQMHSYSGLMATLVPALLGSLSFESAVTSHRQVTNQPRFFGAGHQPTTAAEVNLYYLTGKHSIKNNIPRPSVTEVHGHAYVSIQEIVEHFLAHGMDIDEIALFDSNSDGPGGAVRSVPENCTGQRNSSKGESNIRLYNARCTRWCHCCSIDTHCDCMVGRFPTQCNKDKPSICVGPDSNYLPAAWKWKSRKVYICSCSWKKRR